MSTKPKQIKDRPNTRWSHLFKWIFTLTFFFYLSFDVFVLLWCTVSLFVRQFAPLILGFSWFWTEIKATKTRTHAHSLHCLVFLAFVAVLMATDSASYFFSYISDEKDYMRLVTQISMIFQLYEAVACRHFELVGDGGLWRENQTLMRNIHKLHN